MILQADHLSSSVILGEDVYSIKGDCNYDVMTLLRLLAAN